ncbi:DUF6265 family protein [Novosphingobium ginsenosidimutans]|uniref:DUF6265 domain-containing protein n=1 Tax=Novosphingobium ginsenosidimutans TaxID=1176536 RepID=A0A5B8S6Q1_9SPHN|nr:DUF6265 family protein [Novosphingobium ginsenosidimutans]QEA17266.1 hypothetical protein FRF71_14600 [Novosphingobium ginsenosidimutans]
MKKLVLAALLTLSAPLGAQSAARSLPEWMAGTWVHEDGASWSDEIWTDARGGLMLGLARTGFGPRLDNWEIAQIRRKPDGTISFLAQPQGKPASEFPMVLVSEEAIEFANPAHDYPQRIRYWRQGKLLMAEISKMDGSQVMRWNYRPVVPPQD